MPFNIRGLSERELSDLIDNASKELAAKRQSKKRETIAEMKRLAASIGLSVSITEVELKPSSARKGSSVPVKYRDPANSKNVWTGRGMKPRWLRALLDQGRSVEEFLV
jgi:DNA-binding protein H-NS